MQIALAEDIGTGDLTSESLVAEENIVRGEYLVKQDGVLCGQEIADLVMKEVNRGIAIEWDVEEGAAVSSGTVAGTVIGPARSVLTAERTALNFLQRTSGVATLTDQYVRRVEGTGAVILDTRKTLPGWRLIDKYSVTAGGGVNHRMGLYDMVMVKDNHIAAHGSIAAAVGAVRHYFAQNGISGVGLEVEASTLKQVAEILETDGVTRVMFDNFDIDTMKEGVRMVAGVIETEASGGINLETVRGYAETGVQFISVGALTHSAVALDISLNLEE